MKHTYIVMVDDNYYFPDTSERYKHSEHATYAVAVQVCKTIVDEFLVFAMKPGMTAKQLYSSYTMFGEDPYIIGEIDQHFSAWKYAEEMCKKVTGAN